MMDRREFLLASSAALGAALLAGCGSTAPASVAASDQLFEEGRFGDADRGYADVLARDPRNVHALTLRGYVALLGNQLDRARQLLERSLQLDPAGQQARQLLALTRYRADDFAGAAALGYQAPLLATFAGRTPYDVAGPDVARAPLLQATPVLMVDVSINGSAPAPFVIDTGAGSVGLDPGLARRAGVALIDAGPGGSAVVTGGRQVAPGQLARVDRLAVGGLEVRNVPGATFPASPDGAGGEAGVRAPDGRPVLGSLGTTFLLHFLATLDYPGAALVLRRRTAALQRQVERDARTAGAVEVPYWVHTDHFIDVLATVNGRGSLLATVDTGGHPDYGSLGFLPTDATVGRLGLHVDRSRGVPFSGSGGASTAYPLRLDRVALAGAVQRGVPGAAGVWTTPQLRAPGAVEPVVAGAVSGAFLSRYALTIDPMGMRLFLAS